MSKKTSTSKPKRKLSPIQIAGIVTIVLALLIIGHMLFVRKPYTERDMVIGHMQVLLDTRDPSQTTLVFDSDISWNVGLVADNGITWRMEGKSIKPGETWEYDRDTSMNEMYERGEITSSYWSKAKFTVFYSEQEPHLICIGTSQRFDAEIYVDGVYQQTIYSASLLCPAVVYDE